MPKIDEISDAQIKDLLTSTGRQVSQETLSAIRQFIMNVGGVKNAQMALDTLGRLKEAA